MKEIKNAKLTLRTNSNLKERLKNQSALQGITLSKYINNILKNY
jgi:predicted DNA binding CopG/RHH family protein